jgi:hypothetical protein
MKKLILTNLVVACFSTALAAQTPSGSSQSPSTTRPAAAASEKQSAVLTGCVYKERDVPGRAPNVAERAGVLEDYILADVKPSETASSGSTGGASGATGTSGTMAGATMYKLEKIADERLKAAVGKRVEVTGRIDAEAADAAGSAGGAATTTDKAIGRDRVNLPEFEVTSMKEVSGTCPATPSPAR